MLSPPTQPPQCGGAGTGMGSTSSFILSLIELSFVPADSPPPVPHPPTPPAASGGAQPRGVGGSGGGGGVPPRVLQAKGFHLYLLYNG
jgi:hypothetical protein